MGNASYDGFAMVMNRVGTVVIPMLSTEDINSLLDIVLSVHLESVSKSPFATPSRTRAN